MKYIMFAIIIMCTSSMVMADNTFIKDCMKDYQTNSFQTYNYSKAAACVQKYRTQEQEIEVAEMRDDLIGSGNKLLIGVALVNYRLVELSVVNHILQGLNNVT